MYPAFARNASPHRAGACALLLALVILIPSPCRADPDVHVLRYEGPITPVASEVIVDGLESAAEQNGGVFILQLDTPGGLDTDMRAIIKAMLASPLPVVVHVAPGGSRAASAGAFITVAAHVAAMAPGTNIGSASPVQMMGAGMDSTMTSKVTNDAAAYMTSLADKRGRNAEMARSFVVGAVNITAEEALAEGIIDLVVASETDLLDQLDGRRVVLEDGEVVLSVGEGRVVRHTMGWRLEFLKRLVDPNLAYLLFLLGIYGLFFELSNPGSLVPGILGAISILLALYAFHALPVDYTGVALILLGVVLLILEVKVPSFGALTLGGIAGLVLGSMMLFDAPGQWARVSLKVIIPSVIVFVGFFLLCVSLVVRGQKRPPVTGKQALVGEEGRVISVDSGEPGRGKAYLHGEVWDVVADQALAPGNHVKIIALEGRVARVERLGATPAEDPTGGV